MPSPTLTQRRAIAAAQRAAAALLAAIEAMPCTCDVSTDCRGCRADGPARDAAARLGILVHALHPPRKRGHVPAASKGGA